MKPWETQRDVMVRQQLVRRGLRDPAVLHAMRTVPREVFVPERFRKLAYRDGPLPIEAGQTISQPFIVALMLAAVEPEPTDRLLEVGAGSGYALAVASRCVAESVGLERHKPLITLARQRLEQLGYDNAAVHHADGTVGWPDAAPFDAILVAAGAAEVPNALRDQLAAGGRLVMPLGKGRQDQCLTLLRRVGPDRFESRPLGPVRFVPLVSEPG